MAAGSLAGHVETVSKEHFDKKVTSMVVYHSPLMMKLFKAGRTTSEVGTKYVWHPRYARRGSQHYGRYERLGKTIPEYLTEAEMGWRYKNTRMQLAGQDVSENTPGERVLDLLAEELDAGKDDCIYDFAEHVWTGIGGAKYPTGLTTAIEKTPTVSGTTYAGIVRGTDDVGSGSITDWWSNQSQNLSGVAVTRALFNKAYMLGCRGRAKPNLIITSKEGYRQLWELATEAERFPNTTMAKLGFEHVYFNGVMVVWDDHCPVGADDVQWWVLNLKGDQISMRFQKGKRMHRTPWKTPIDYDMMISDYRNAYMVLCKDPAAQTLLYGGKSSA